MLVSKLFRYSIDQANGRFVKGWCFHRFLKKHPVILRIEADDHLLGNVNCTSYRKDIKIKQLHPTGYCGFDFNLPDGFNLQNFQNLHFYAGKYPLPLATLSCLDLETLRPESSENFFFMHIPKTAGSTLNAFLRCCYPSSQCNFHIERLDYQERINLVSYKKCISGHLPWYQLRDLLVDSNYQLYAIIRDPYEQLHSHFNYVRCVQSDAEHEDKFAYRHNKIIRELSIQLNKVKFSNDSEIEKLIHNCRDYQLDFFDNMQTRYFLDYRPEKVTMADFEHAKSTIDQFKLVGLTEHYDRYLKRLCHDLQLPPQVQAERSNKSDSYKLFDHSLPSTKNALHPFVEVDLKIYQYIVEKFWSDVE